MSPTAEVLITAVAALELSQVMVIEALELLLVAIRVRVADVTLNVAEGGKVA